jgi:hypothetical protein
MSGREKFIKIDIVASGNISIEKQLFTDRDVYAPGLQIPVGEEYELSAYLSTQKIPIYFAPDIKGWHLQPTTITDSCKQNYKHGEGIAELAINRPDVLFLDQPRHIWEMNRSVEPSDPFQLKLKKVVRKWLATERVRNILLSTANTSTNILPSILLFPLYRLVVGSFFVAGIADGTKRFGKKKIAC